MKESNSQIDLKSILGLIIDLFVFNLRPQLVITSNLKYCSIIMQFMQYIVNHFYSLFFVLYVFISIAYDNSNSNKHSNVNNTTSND